MKQLLSRKTLYLMISLGCIALTAQAQRPQANNQVRNFIKVEAPAVVLTDARVIDGTGAAGRAQQTILIRDGRISALGSAGSVTVPEGATVIDLSGKSVIPGLVMLHEHLYYPVGPGV